jgi:oligosaccharide repeat unit polymerase
MASVPFLVVIYLFNHIDRPELASATFITWILIGIVAASLIANLIKNRDILNPLNMVCAIYLLWFGYSPLYIISYRTYDFSTPNHLNNIIVYAELIALIGFVFFLIGYTIPLGKKLSRKLRTPHIAFHKKRIKILRLIALVVGLAAAVAYFSQLGGVSYYWVHLVGERYKYSAGKGYMIFLTIMPLLISIYAFCVHKFLGKNDRLAWFYIISGFFIAISTGSRGRGILPIILMGVMIHYIYSARRGFLRGWNMRALLKRYAVVGVAVALLFFAGTMLMEVRRIAHNYSSLSEAVMAVEKGERGEGVSGLGELVFHMTLSNYWYLSLHDYLDEYMDLEYGLTIIQAALLPIPRALWNGKPADTPGSRFGKIATGYFVGAPYTYIGDLYWNFHVIGVMFGMLLLGLLIRTLYEWNLRNMVSGGITGILIYGTVIPVVIISFAGTFYGAFGTLMQYVALLFLFLIFSGVSRRHGRVQFRRLPTADFH